MIFTEEHRRKLSEAARRRGPPRKATQASADKRRGKPLTSKQREVISKQWTPERRARQSEAMKGNDIAGRFTPEGRAALARAVTSRHQAKERTGLEQSVEAELQALGLDFERQARVDGDPHHTWDFVLRAERVLIEADGCYWHGCERCGHDGLPVNRRNDKAKNTMARRLGWRLIRIKECSDAKAHLAPVAAGI